MGCPPGLAPFLQGGFPQMPPHMNESTIPTSTATAPPPAAAPAKQLSTGWYLAGVIFALLVILVLFVRVQSRRYNPPRPARRVRRVI